MEPEQSRWKNFFHRLQINGWLYAVTKLWDDVGTVCDDGGVESFECIDDDGIVKRDPIADLSILRL